MKKSAFALMTISVMILASCAQLQPGQQPGGEVITYYPQPVVEHKEYSLFELGRMLSRNSVDIFDPELATFSIPPDMPEAANPLAAFPAHPFMLVRDEEVTVFSLSGTDGIEISSDVTAPPVPLTADEGQLPP